MTALKMMAMKLPLQGAQWGESPSCTIPQCVSTEPPRHCSPRMIQHDGNTDTDPLPRDMALLLASRTP